MSARTVLILSCTLISAATLFVATAQEASVDLTMFAIDHPAIQYTQAHVEDPVARLDMRLASGKAKLEYSPAGLGYLRSLLENLAVNPDSRMLVFSKTSFQAARISPRNPRALFFNDDVMIGNVRGGDVLELAALDPRLGYLFYTLDVQKADQPRFVRRDSCLQCHHGPATLGVPGIMVGSVYPDSSGMPASRMGNPVTDHHTPLQDRWGGWYVTGTHGGMRHKGNAVARDQRHPDLLETQGTQNLLSLDTRFDAANGYLSPASDIVALMVLEHQTRMTNLITRTGWAERIAEKDGKADDPATRKQIDADIEALVTYMLFTDEAKLYDPIEGVSTFTRTFAQRGPRDHQGRSLRDFDLQKRLFRYPFSYMIYSAAFDALPDPVRERVYRRVYAIVFRAELEEPVEAVGALEIGNFEIAARTGKRASHRRLQRGSQLNAFERRAPTKTVGDLMKLFIVLLASTLPCLSLAAGKGDLKAGTAVFATNCKTCHGTQGEGNPAIAKVLKIEIPNLGSKEVQDLTDEQLKSIVTDGKGKMKPVKTVSGKQLDDVVTFIRSLAKP